MKKQTLLSLGMLVLLGTHLADAKGTGQIGSGGVKQELPEGFEIKKLDDISLIVRSNDRDSDQFISKELLNSRTVLGIQVGNNEPNIRVICTDKSVVDCKKFRFVFSSRAEYLKPLPDDSAKLNNVRIYSEEYGSVSQAEAEIILRMTSNTVAHDNTATPYFGFSRYAIYMTLVDGKQELLPIALPITALMDVVTIPFVAVENAQYSSTKEKLAGEIKNINFETTKVSFTKEQFDIFENHLSQNISKPLN